MRIGILMTNTDESAFADAHPRDGEKWRALLAPLVPDWSFPVYAVKDGEFPDHVDGHDGFIITGSPASVNDLAPWLDRLFVLIREAVARKMPLFGACFGHQAIALALGGAVEANPGGWVFGTTETEVTDPAAWMEPGPLRQYAAHVEQVTRPPEGAALVMGNAACPVGGFTLGTSVFTTQYHPEITHDFMTALVEEYGPKLPAEVAEVARASLAQRAETARVAGWIVAFFRQAVG